MFHQLIDLEVRRFVDISNFDTRGRNFKIKRLSVNNNCNEFSNRSAHVWNSLLDAVVNCKSLSLFKYKLKSSNINIVHVYPLVIYFQCNCFIAYTICAAFHSSVDYSQLRLVLVTFSYYLHTVIRTFTVYFNQILFSHTVSVCWRDANIHAIRDCLLILYIFYFVLSINVQYCNLMCEINK